MLDPAPIVVPFPRAPIELDAVFFQDWHEGSATPAKAV